MPRNLCLVADCRQHRDDDAWIHLAPKREIPITAHLRMRAEVAA